MHGLKRPINSTRIVGELRGRPLLVGGGGQVPQPQPGDAPALPLFQLAGGPPYLHAAVGQRHGGEPRDCTDSAMRASDM